MKYIAFSALSAAALAACGGSGSGESFVQVGPAAAMLGPSEVDVEITPSGDTITVVKSGGVATAATDTAPDNGTFKTAYDTTGDYTLAFVSTGDGSVAGGTSFKDGADYDSGIFYARTETTALPEAGSASFAGDYLGMLVIPSTEVSVFGLGITGDAALSVDFGAQTVSGMITGRELVLLTTGDAVDGSSVADLTLAETALGADGGFAGSGSGGAYSTTTDTSTTSAISYEGLIAGATAEEAVGGVSVTHSIGGTALEIGAFAAGH